MSVNSHSKDPSIRIEIKKVNDIKLENISKFNSKIVQFLDSLDTQRQTYSFRKKVNNCLSIKQDYQEPYTRMFKLPKINNLKENLVKNREVIRNVKIDALNILGCTRNNKSNITGKKRYLCNKNAVNNNKTFISDSKRLKLLIKDKQFLLN